MAEAARLVLYGRAYCHLCDDMVAALREIQPEYGFSVQIVDIDTDPALVARYDELVPVLTLKGAEICHYHLDRERLDTLLGQLKGSVI